MADEKKSGCSHCGSANLIRGISVSRTNAVGEVGLSHRSTWLGAKNAEPLLADLCDDCGTVARLYVEAVGKAWVSNE